MTHTAVAVFVALAIAVLGTLQYRGVLARRAARAAYVAPLLALLEDARATPSAVDFPRVTGRYKGHDVQIEPHTDSMTARKLPVLWLLVTLKEPLPLTASLDVMTRPSNLEYWSPFESFPIDLARPAHWPDTANLRADQEAGSGKLRTAVEPHLDFLGHPKGKEILITPKGVRFTWLAEEGDRNAYLIMRQAQFSGEPIDPVVVGRLLERCLAVAEAVKRGV